jgi:hypothetical protein
MAKVSGKATTTWIRYSQALKLASEYLGNPDFVEREIRRGLAAEEIPWQCARFEAPPQYSGSGSGDREFWKFEGQLRIRDGSTVIETWRGIHIEGDSAIRTDDAAAHGLDLDRSALVRLKLLPPDNVGAGTLRSTKRVHRLTPTEVAAREEFPPDGIPPDTLPTSKALRQLEKRMQRDGLKTSDDTMRRAIGRR